MTINTKLGQPACTRMIIQLLIDIQSKNLRYGYIHCKWEGDLVTMIAASRAAMGNNHISSIEIDRNDITVHNNPTIYRNITIMPGLF